MNQVNSRSEKSSTFFRGSKLFNTKTLPKKQKKEKKLWMQPTQGKDFSHSSNCWL